jgi:hypothetical protein
MPLETVRRLSSIALLLLFAAALPVGTAAEPPASQAAAELADRVLEAMGGREAWEATRYLRFNFFGFRLHHWDRYTGRHRLEGKTQDGDEYLVLHNVLSREGEAWMNGQKLSGEKRAELLENAYGAWVNDTYWLLMPYKLRDPGVNLALDGEEEIDGVVYDKLLLTFDGVGLTPGDRYWAYVNRESGVMERWAYHLEGWEADREPTHWRWLDWQRYGRILLSPRRVNPADGSERTLGELAVFDHLPDEVFTSPGPVENQ